MTSCKNKTIAVLIGCLTAAFPAKAQDISLEEDDIFNIPSVKMSSLRQIKPDAVGLLLSSDHQLLNDNVWKNSKYANVVRRFRKTRNLHDFPAAEALRRKLLLLAAPPPEGTPESAFVKARLKELYRKGYFQNILDILAQLPPQVLDLTTADLEINTNFFVNNPKRACEIVKKSPDDDVDRQKQNVICAALQKDENKTLLPLAMLEEQKVNDDFLTDAADALIAGKNTLSTSPKQPTPLNLFLLAKFKKEPPAFFWKSKTDNVLNALVILDSAPVDKKIEIAEKLVQRGVLPPENLATLYKTPSFDNFVPDDSSPYLLRAYLFQQALKPRDDVERAKRLTVFLAHARNNGVFVGSALAAGEILDGFDGFYDISPITANAEIMKALVLNGELFKAENIMDDYYQNLTPNETEAESWHIVKMAKPGKNYLLPRFERMMAYKEKHPPKNGDIVKEVDRLMLIFETLGKQHPTETWMYTSFADNSPEKKFLEALHSNAPLQGVPAAKGEQALEALEHLDGSYVGMLETVQRLKAAGLDEEARQIAAQAVAAGLPG